LKGVSIQILANILVTRSEWYWYSPERQRRKYFAFHFFKRFVFTWTLRKIWDLFQLKIFLLCLI